MIVVLLGLLAGCAETQPSQETPLQKAPPVAPPTPPASDKSASSAEGFTSTKSGLKYKILKEGTGAKPSASDRVKVHYRGWLDNGKEFDSSIARGEPITFPLSGVIPGWTEGLQYCAKGGKIELEIPSDLGYGDRGAPPDIPGGATLHFEVELIDIL